MDIFQSKKFRRAAVLVVLSGTAITIYKKNQQQKHEKVIQVNSPNRRRDIKKTLRRLISIMVPSVATMEFGYIVILSALLVGRTVLSVYMAELLGTGVQHLVSKQWVDAINTIKTFFFISFPASVINSALHYFTRILALSFRIRLSKYIHTKYLNGVTFYNVVNLGSEKIENVDQHITADIEKFSTELAELYANTFKPLLDIILFTYKLAEATGWQGPGILYGYFIITASVKKFLMPSLGRLAKREAQLDGDYRSAHTRLIANSEEVAFYDGSARERTIINQKLYELRKHAIKFSKAKAFISVLDNLLVKYWATIAGYLVQFAPILFGLSTNKSTEELTRDYARNNRYLSNCADSIGQFVLLGNKTNELSGYIDRVGGLIERIDNIETKLVPFDVKEESNNDFVEIDNSKFFDTWKAKMDALQSDVRRANSKDIKIGAVTIIESDIIQFENIDIVSPEGKLLVRDLNFSVKPNQNVMVTGPNGSGKSSLFRILGDLWPPASSSEDKECRILKPPKENILFVPQKSYLVLGTLRDQIIYPHSKEQMQARGVTDDDLENLITIVDPARIIRRNWEWDTVIDWAHAFSGGQRQRVAMARLFYHRPAFAILDECTSAVSDEVEDLIYRTCASLEITLFTVSHRKYLAKFHQFTLSFEGHKGLYNFEPVEYQE